MLAGTMERLRAGLILAGAVVLGPLVPMFLGLLVGATSHSAWAQSIADWTIDAPQYVFPLGIANVAKQRIVPIPWWASALFWLAVCVLFAFAARWMKPKWAALAACATVVLCVVLARALLGLSGYYIMLDPL